MARSSVVGITKTLKVADGSDLSLAAKQFTFVKSSANQRVTTCGAGQSMLGVMMQLAVGTPQSVTIRLSGTALLKVAAQAAPIIAGDRIKSDANGRGVKAIATETAGGIALEGADADDVVIEVKLIDAAAAA